MKKDEPLQKKKTLGNTILRLGIRGSIAIAVIVFFYFFYSKIDFSSTSYAPKTGYNKNASNTPNELKWFDDFKGVENVGGSGDRQQSSGQQNFLQYESNKNKK